MSASSLQTLEPIDTPALRVLREAGVPFTIGAYSYVEHGGTAVSSSSLNYPEHWVIKTLIFLDRMTGTPFVVLQHGDMQVDTSKLAKQLQLKKVACCAPDDAEKVTGYRVGGTSPFGLKTPLKIYMERSILHGDDTVITDSSAPAASSTASISLPTSITTGSTSNGRPSHVYINGGNRGTLVLLTPEDIVKVVSPTLITCAKPHTRKTTITSVEPSPCPSDKPSPSPNASDAE